MFETIIREVLADIVKAYAGAMPKTGAGKRLSTAQISKRCYGNAVFLDDFFAGRQSMSVKKMSMVLEWFSDHWPDDARRPAPRVVMMGIPRKK